MPDVIFNNVLPYGSSTTSRSTLKTFDKLAIDANYFVSGSCAARYTDLVSRLCCIMIIQDAVFNNLPPIGPGLSSLQLKKKTR